MVGVMVVVYVVVVPVRCELLWSLKLELSRSLPHWESLRVQVSGIT